MPIIIVDNLEQTAAFARQVALTLTPGDMIALFGGMGMGKTTFVAALCRALGFKGEVSSPTFALVHEYEGGRLPVYHFDMFRVKSWDDLYSTGFFEYLERPGVVVAEWSENIETALPDGYISIEICPGKGETAREFKWTPKKGC